MPSENSTLRIAENISLAPMTTLGVGGPARYFAECISEQQVEEALRWASARSLKVFVLGGGSNLLVSDLGFSGLVIRIALTGVTSSTEQDGRVRISAAAGEEWDPVVALAVEMGCAGLECLSGIPGSVGGTPVQNVGAYGQEVSDTITAVRAFDRDANRIVELSNAECGFSYRKSIFNTRSRERYVVLRVDYALVASAPPTLTYRELAEMFTDGRPSLADVRNAVIAIRRKKSMVIDPADPNSRSAGSFFKNPVIPIDKFETLRTLVSADVPHFAAGEGSVKVPAAWLVENAGFERGYVTGNVGISSNHSLAIVNRGGASASELVNFHEAIIAAVRERFSITLVPEPVFLGFDV